MAKAQVTVRVADLPQVKATIRALENERDDLRGLLQAFVPRVGCPQCGLRYSERACGPSHAVVWRLIDGGGVA